MDDIERRVISLEEWRKHMEAVMSVNMAQHEKIENRLVILQDTMGSHIADEATRQASMYRLLITSALGAIGGLVVTVIQLLMAK